MPKSRIRLRVQLISGRGSNDLVQWLARREAARVLDEEVGDERAAPGVEATADVGKDQDPVPRARPRTGLFGPERASARVAVSGRLWAGRPPRRSRAHGGCRS